MSNQASILVQVALTHAAGQSKEQELIYFSSKSSLRQCRPKLEHNSNLSSTGLTFFVGSDKSSLCRQTMATFCQFLGQQRPASETFQMFAKYQKRCLHSTYLRELCYCFHTFPYLQSSHNQLQHFSTIFDGYIICKTYKKGLSIG